MRGILEQVTGRAARIATVRERLRIARRLAFDAMLAGEGELLTSVDVTRIRTAAELLDDVDAAVGRRTTGAINIRKEPPPCDRR